MLISSMMGIMERTTMDMDTTVNGINMDEDEISDIIKEILQIDVGDKYLGSSIVIRSSKIFYELVI